MTAVKREKTETRRRWLSVLGSAAFLIVAPGTVAGAVPWWISRWHVHAPFPGFTLLRVIGVLLIIAGVPVLLESFARFALQGMGTPAPVFPTEHLVVKGFYRFVRNPMYVSVLAVLIGQALFLGNIDILVYAAFAWLIAHLFVLGYEEPTLRKSFGAKYEAYRSHVPRWLPRLTPWRSNIR
ncbi:MAG: isoprenylcysteine carboxylmethyltransferase family protein [Silvibacterium sp.]